ncbi:MAG TPA: M1 family metallopeptidase [Hanamia sp.]|nr:M1 family metallopeptidase [Hanamia sp.]
MKTCIILLVLTGFFFIQAHAQSLYMPRNVKTAFEKRTRAINGNPGAHYWQNHSNYNIDLTVTPPGRTIKGSEQITYFNDSPDTLNTIVFSLIMNYQKPEAERLINLDSTQLTSGIHIDHFEINGEETSWPVLLGHYTRQDVNLSQPLLPGDSIHFSVQWHYEIAPAFVRNGRSLREGMIDPTTYCVAYFYPCVSVFDDYNGWDRLEFTGAQEFYNDFSNYTLKVNVPKNFIVWATGTLQNPQQVLQPHYAQLLKESMTSDAVVHIATPQDLESKNITTQNEINTWIWKANDVTEVALFISDHDNWDAASVVVDSASGRRASMQAAYYDTSADFHEAVAIGQKALSWYSRNLPGVPYPYPKMTVVEGFAGMEYPMMANDGAYRTSNPIEVRFEENHEISHTYFPFYMGTNESRYAFMDEGWAETFNGLIGATEYGSAIINESYEKLLVRDPSQEQQVPVVASNFQTGLAYANNAYFKPMMAYMALKDLLGEKLFKKCLQGYIARWHGHHPIPWDFFNAFNNISGKDLNWFWNSWFFSHGYTDLSVENVIGRRDDYAVTVKNVGGFDIPFDVKINYTDGTNEDIHETPIVWKNDGQQTVINIRTHKKISTLVIDTGLWADANEKDNGWRMSER